MKENMPQSSELAPAPDAVDESEYVVGMRVKIGAARFSDFKQSLIVLHYGAEWKQCRTNSWYWWYTPCLMLMGSPIVSIIQRQWAKNGSGTGTVGGVVQRRSYIFRGGI